MNAPCEAAAIPVFHWRIGNSMERDTDETIRWQQSKLVVGSIRFHWDQINLNLCVHNLRHLLWIGLSFAMPSRSIENDRECWRLEMMKWKNIYSCRSSRGNSAYIFKESPSRNRSNESERSVVMCAVMENVCFGWAYNGIVSCCSWINIFLAILSGCFCIRAFELKWFNKYANVYHLSIALESSDSNSLGISIPSQQLKKEEINKSASKPLRNDKILKSLIY